MKPRFVLSSAHHAFSLVEIMVAVSVLALLLVLLLQVVNGTLVSSRTANQQMDATGAARRALDVMASDIQNSVVGPIATLLGSTPPSRLAMLTQGRGPNTSPSTPRFLAVQYVLSNGNSPVADTLQRSYSAVSWTTTDLLAATTNGSAGTANLATGVLALSIQAILENGDRRDVNVAPGPKQAWGVKGGDPYPPSTGNATITRVPNGFTALVPSTPPTPTPLDASTARVLAIEITLVAIDEQNYKLLKQTGTLSIARNAFSATGTDLPAARWAQAINTLNGVPRPAQTAMRVLTRTVSLP